MWQKFLNFYLKQDRLIFYCFAFSILSTLFLILITLLSLSRLPTQLPLYYSLPWGDKQLATHGQFFILPGLIVLISLINFAFISHLHSSQLLLRRTLAFSLVLFSFMIVFSALKIILIFI